MGDDAYGAAGEWTGIPKRKGSILVHGGWTTDERELLDEAKGQHYKTGFKLRWQDLQNQGFAIVEF